jgi:hypothetical protein
MYHPSPNVLSLLLIKLAFFIFDNAAISKAQGHSNNMPTAVRKHVL